MKGVFDSSLDIAYFSSSNQLLSLETEDEESQTAASIAANTGDTNSSINLDLDAKNDQQVNLLDEMKNVPV